MAEFSTQLVGEVYVTTIGNQGGSSGGGLVSITYTDLKALRNEGKLVAGQQYRITDYHCTTTQENTKSADHQFDIIVTADDENTLNENARAVQREGSEVVYKVENLGVDAAFARYADGDTIYEGTQYYAFDVTLDEETHLVLYATSENPNSGDAVYGDIESTGEISILPTTWIKTSNDYFASSNLAMWELKYSIDNDTQRFAWAKPFGYGASLVCHAYGSDSDGFLMKTSEFTEDGKEIWVVVDPSRYTDDREDMASPDIVWIKIINPDFADRMFAEYGDVDVAFYSMDRQTESWSCEIGDPIMCAPQIAGSGIIYYMKDEFGNECPYDFKNLMFKRNISSGGAYKPDGSGTDTFIYTFSHYRYGTLKDASLIISDTNMCNNNVVGASRYANPDGYYTMMPQELLPDVVFINNEEGYVCSENIVGADCSYITFGSSCYGNTIDERCTNNFINDGSEGNRLGFSVSGCTLVSAKHNVVNASNNTFKSGASNNVVVDHNSQNNTFNSFCNYKVVHTTSNKTFNDSVPEFWFYNTKKW